MNLWRLAMDLKKLAPWNWFKNEEEQEQSTKMVDVKHYNPFTAVQSSGFTMPDVDRYFNGLLNSWGRNQNIEPASLIKPNADLIVEDKKYILTIEIPGVEEKDVSINVADNTMTITGEKKQEVKEKNSNYYRVERSYGSFQRILSLPDDVDQDNINASIKKGVLKISMPRVEKENDADKPIPITAG
jgi:HSP20 family protein